MELGHAVTGASGKLGRARLYYAWMLLSDWFLTISLTGLVISSWLDLALANAAAWLEVHILASIATLIVTVIKIGLHWRWVVAVAKKPFAAKKAFGEPADHLRRPIPAVPAAGARQMNRREFLQVMGVVSFASLFAIGSAVNGLQIPESTQASSDALAQASSANPSSRASSNQSCSVRCGRACSFPGHCRRYTDSNGNNRCDNGECA
jgi:hypothetical protein